MKGAEAVVKNLSVVRSACRSRERAAAATNFTHSGGLHFTPFHSYGISMAVRNPTVCVGHEAVRDPRGHNETRSTLTKSGTELTMSTNLQLSLRQLAPIECRRRPSRRGTGPTFPSPPLLASFLFPRAHGHGSSAGGNLHATCTRLPQVNCTPVGCRMNFH